MKFLKPLLTAALAAGNNSNSITQKLSIDHIVYVVPDLEEAMNELEGKLGVRPDIGGKHPALGTHNALLGLGEGRYLELFAPDPEATSPLMNLIGVDGPKPRISTFCCSCGAKGQIDIEALTSKLAATKDAEFFPAVPEAGSRRNQDDDSLVAWKVAVDKHGVPSDKLPMGGLIPFLIEWDPDCLPARPATRAPGGCRLVKLEGFHPNPERLKSLLQTMGADDVMDVQEGPEPQLVVSIETPNNGIVKLM